MTTDLDLVYKTFIDLRNAGRNAHLMMRYDGWKTFASLEIELSGKGIDSENDTILFADRQDEPRERGQHREGRIDGTREGVPNSQRQENHQKKEVDKMTEIGLKLAHSKTTKEVSTEKCDDTQRRDIGIQVETDICIAEKSKTFQKNDSDLQRGTVQVETCQKVYSEVKPCPSKAKINIRYLRRTFESEKISWKSTQRPNPLSPQITHRKAYHLLNSVRRKYNYADKTI